MEDSGIVELYWARSEQAIHETRSKYGAYCFSIANNILPYREDAEECVNDTWLAAWDSIPPNRPKALSTFLGKLTRRISIDRWRKLSAAKRGGGTVPVVLEELAECIPGGGDPEAEVEARELAEAVGGFLDTLPYIERRAFLMRYFDLAMVRAIACELHLSSGKVKAMLHRTRGKLRAYLKKEGY